MNLASKHASFLGQNYYGKIISNPTTCAIMFNRFFLILCRTVIENSKSVRRNIRRSTFFQREFKVLTFLHSADKIFRNHAIDYVILLNLER